MAPFPPYFEAYCFIFTFNIQITQLVSPVKPAMCKSLIFKPKKFIITVQTFGCVLL